MNRQAMAETFRREGYLTGISVATAAEADEIRRQFDHLESRVGQEKASIGLVDYHYSEPFLWRLATRPEILDCVEAILGPNVLLLASHFFCKYGQTQKFVAWHQDVTYWALEPPMALTAWYAVDASDRENGCMRVLPGTHREGVREHGKSGTSGNLLSINQEVPVTPEEEASATDLVLQAGEMSLHDGALIHGSLPNLSTRRRCGLTLRYIPTTVGPKGMNAMNRPWNPVLVRGADNEGNWGDTPVGTRGLSTDNSAQ